MHECEAGDLVRRELTLGDDAGALHVGFRDLDGAIGVDRLDDGHMAVIAVGAFLARCEHEYVAHGARRVVDPVAERLRGSAQLRASPKNEPVFSPSWWRRSYDHHVHWPHGYWLPVSPVGWFGLKPSGRFASSLSTRSATLLLFAFALVSALTSAMALESPRSQPPSFVVEVVVAPTAP